MEYSPHPKWPYLLGSSHWNPEPLLYDFTFEGLMTREIKFRALEKNITYPGWSRWVFYEAGDKLQEPSLPNHFEIKHLQYTGLKDKDGTEIYEGDVVKIKHVQKGGPFDKGRSDSISQVIFDATANMGCWSLPESFELLYQVNGDIEIIGNIYENPELLESL